MTLYHSLCETNYQTIFLKIKKNITLQSQEVFKVLKCEYISHMDNSDLKSTYPIKTTIHMYKQWYGRCFCKRTLQIKHLCLRPTEIQQSLYFSCRDNSLYNFSPPPPPTEFYRWEPLNKTRRIRLPECTVHIYSESCLIWPALGEKFCVRIDKVLV